MSIEYTTSGLVHRIDDERHIGPRVQQHCYRKYLELLEEFGPMDTMELAYCFDMKVQSVAGALRFLKEKDVVYVVDQRPAHCGGLNIWDLTANRDGTKALLVNYGR